MEEKQKMLLQLQEVLRVKNFSLDVKARIKRVLLETWDTETNKKIFFDIIEGLKKIETFKINTRKQLLKIAAIKDNLDSQTCGYVTSKKDIAVVVKGKTEDSTTYHELVHVSQPENAYHINQKYYPFSELFEIAMKEGEAVFRQSKYSRKELVIYDGNNQETKTTIINREMVVHPISYYVFQELYEDMIGLLGEQKVEEWKHHGYNKDMILEFDKYVSQEKQTKFRVLYQWWGILLYQYMKEEDQFKETAEISFNRMKKLKKDHDIKIEIVCERIEKTKENEKLILEELEDYQKQFASEEYMQKKYQELLDDYQKDIESIIKEEGITDYVKELQKDLEDATFEEYKKSIELYYQADVADLEENKKRIADASIEKQAVEWASEFLPQEEILEKPVKELAMMKNMLLHVVISPDQLIPEMFYKPTELYAINLNRSEKTQQKK